MKLLKASACVLFLYFRKYISSHSKSQDGCWNCVTTLEKKVESDSDDILSKQEQLRQRRRKTELLVAPFLSFL